MSEPGTAPTIVFAHANGFPAGTYRQLFDHWRSAGWQVLAPDRLGHDRAYPVRSNWHPTRDEFIAFVEAQGLAGRRRGLHFVGHSLGGYVALLAACRRPELAASVVLMDSPLVGGWRAGSLRVAKAVGLIGRMSPAKVSRRRRTHWASADEARALFAAKRSFARWAPGVLDDYLAAGLEPAADGGVQLRFRRETESRFYNTLPHHWDAVLRRHPPRCPVHFIGGTTSDEVRQAGMLTTQRVVGSHLQWIDGSHLFPMERPAETAQAVLRAIG